MDTLLKNNKIVLLIALVLSLLLWFSVRGTSDSGSMINESSSYSTLDGIPVTITNVPDDVTNETTHPTVTLALRGDRISLMQARLISSSIHCIADASGLRAGSHQLQVKVVGLPSGVVAENTMVTIHLVTNVSKDMHVELSPDGSLADGYAVGSMKVDPASVTLKGPEKAVAKVQKAVASIALQKNDTGTIARTVTVHAVNDMGLTVDQVQVYPQTVSVLIQIVKPTQTLPVKVQIEGLPKEGFAVDSVSALPETVDVLGDTGSLISYPTPMLSVAGLTEDKTFSVSLAPIPGVTQVSPSTVSVAVHVVPATKKTLAAIPIQITGTPTGFNAVLASAKADVSVEGNKAFIAAVQPKDIGLTVDLSFAVPGSSPETLFIPIGVKAPAGVRANLPGGSTATVTLTKTDVPASASAGSQDTNVIGENGANHTTVQSTNQVSGT